MNLVRRLARYRQIWRYYQAGVLNTVFGFAMYALLIKLGLNMYVAQIISHLLGVAFNYSTYSRYVFAGSRSAKIRFVASYVVNYLLGLSALFLFSQVVASPYAAGLLATIAVSIINYFALKHLVFKPAAPAP